MANPAIEQVTVTGGVVSNGETGETPYEYLPRDEGSHPNWLHSLRYYIIPHNPCEHTRRDIVGIFGHRVREELYFLRCHSKAEIAPCISRDSTYRHCQWVEKTIHRNRKSQEQECRTLLPSSDLI